MRGHDLFRYVGFASCLLCYLTILLGGNVMANDSGLACPQWPSCQGNFFPALSGGVAIEWSHRLSALVLSISITALALLGVAFERHRPVLLRLGLASFALVVAQALLGGLVVESNLTVGVVLFHLALATALFGLLLLLVFLANLREVPRRWIDWARKATDEQPARSGLEAEETTNRDPADAGVSHRRPSIAAGGG